MVVLAATLLLLPLQTPPVSAQTPVAGNPIVIEAEEDLQDAEASYAEQLERLDALAESFETAREHAIRLGDELEGSEENLEDARDALADATAAREAQIRAAYKQPGIDTLRTSGAFLLSPDVGSALHTAAVMARVATIRAEAVEQVRAAGRRLASDISSRQDVSSGTAAAMEDLRDLSGVFNDALEEAADRVAVAQTALEEAEELAEQQALAGQFQGFQGSFGYVPPPVLRQATIPGGTQVMTCPVGQPNGFIDSWGFPRSGGRRHKGVDMFATYGMPIFAAADGYIRRVFHNTLGGLSIDLVDTLGNRYYYAHLSAAYVSDFQSVQAGQLIAANGNSGNAIATPPHLHWQFHPGDGGPVNPFPLAAALCR